MGKHIKNLYIAGPFKWNNYALPVQNQISNHQSFKHQTDDLSPEITI